MIIQKGRGEQMISEVRSGKGEARSSRAAEPTLLSLFQSWQEPDYYLIGSRCLGCARSANGKGRGGGKPKGT